MFRKGNWLSVKTVTVLLHKRDIDTEKHEIRGFCWNFYEDPFDLGKWTQCKPDCINALLSIVSLHVFGNECISDRRLR